MRVPRDMVELERRCWTLAGDRMVSESLSAVVRFDSGALVAREMLFRMVSSRELDQPVALFFNDVYNEDLASELPEHEWMALARTFLRWAGSTEGARDGWVRAVDGLDEEPPRGRQALRKWLMKHGVRQRLKDPIRGAAPLATTFRARQEVTFAGPKATIEDALEGRLSPRYRRQLEDAARSYLSWAAGRLRKRRGREELWAAEPRHEAVRAAAERVHRLLDELDRADVPAVPFPADGVSFGPSEDGFAFGIQYPNPHGGRPRRLFVHLIEKRAGRALHTLDDPRTVRDWEQLRLAAEWACDVLYDEEHEMHAPLREALERPRWTHLLAQLQAEVQPEPEPQPFEANERLVWRVGHADGEGLFVEPAIQKRKKGKRRGWTKGRRVDAGWLLGRPAPLDPRDRRVLTAMRDPCSYRRGGVGRVLEALVGHPRVVWADKPAQPLRVRRGSVDLALEQRRGQTWLAVHVGDRMLEPSEVLDRRLFPSHLGFLEPERGEITVVEVAPAVFAMAEAWAKWETGLPPAADDALIALLERLPPSVGLELPPRLRGERRRPDATPVLRLEPLPGGGLRATVALRPLGVGPTQPPGEGPLHLVGAEDGTRIHVVRDLAAERKAAERVVARLGLDAGVPDGPHTWRLDDPEDALDLLAALREDPDQAVAEWPEDMAPWNVVGRAGFSNLKVKGRELGQWFEVRGEVALDEDEITLAQIMAALRDGRRYVTLGEGRFARIEDELRAQLEPARDVVFADGDQLGVSAAALGELEALLPEDVLEADRAWKETRERLAASAEREVRPPGGLEARLRDYQREGVEWLLRVSGWAAGACLADDMGLGKTVQSLALLLARGGEGPSLVVCPTSLSDNWRKECARFTPALSPRTYRGPSRAPMLEGIGANDLLITSYDVMLRDVEALEAIEWSTVVFDEAHALKNPEAQRAKAAARLNAGFRLGLTGTPLENHLGELWSLFSILVPGLLGPKAHFRDRFAIPIERESDPDRLERLRSLLRPFLLRRTKDQVAPELPPRTEVVRTVELSEEERALYEVERRTALAQLDERPEDPKKRFAVLAALTRLRRLACHPALVHPESRVRSSKLAAALELMEDLRREGHRALVFSQFTSHLALVRRGMEALGIEPFYLDGSTPAAKRDELVTRWQGGERDFFLISLKAGGTGLNLTAADTVLHLDPWWNPAAEDQASDRTHRIGQDKPVTVVRLVSQDTIEEQVVALHEEKRELARGILEGAETNAKLSVSELVQLLEG